jgi:16S rRNA (uracil1498-N3)-methyltransferase
MFMLTRDLTSASQRRPAIPHNRRVPPRFYAPGADRPGNLVDLPQDEAEHLTRVLRLKAGAMVRVFNGRGGEFDAVIEATAKGRARVRLGDARPAPRTSRIAVTLAQTALKGDKMDDVVRDAVMMGVAVIQPIVTVRSEVSLAALQRGRRRARWERIAISAAKQCGRADVPPILEPCALADALATAGQPTLPAPRFIFVEPAAADGAQTLGELAAARPRETTVLIGPEGGWTTEELDRAVATCRPVTLGGRTIRADAMALVALAALYAIWQEF